MSRCTECNLVGGCWCETETPKAPVPEYVISSPVSVTLERTTSVASVRGDLDTLNEIAQLAYGLGVPGYAPIEWFDSMRTHGRVLWWEASKKIIRVQFSSTVWPYLSPAERRDVVLHEVAHAKTVGHHHDHVWKAAYRALGGTGNRTADALPLDVQERISKWRGSCPNGHIIYRGRLTQKAKTMSCGYCCPNNYNHALQFTWRQLR